MKLKELFTFLPKSDKPASYGKESGMYPFFTSSNVINKYVDEADYSGEFLIIGDGGTGNCKYYNGAFSASDHNYVLKPINHKNTRLIRYFLMKDDYKVLNEGFKGVGIKNISKSYIGEIEYSKNSKYSDEFVVDSLDHINVEIDKLNKKLFLFDELIKSRFIELFGDPIENSKNLKTIPLKKLGILERGKSQHRPRNDASLLNGPYPLIQTGDVKNSDTYITKYTSTYSEKGLKQSKMWKKGTLCITIAANIAETAILGFDACFPDSVVGFRPNDNVTTIFIHNWFKFLQPILEEKAPSVAQKNLNLEILGNVEVIVPKIDLQIGFENSVKQIDKLKFNVQKQIKYYQELLDLKMHEYFDVKEED